MANTKKVMLVFGTRPEIIKMYPIVEALQDSGLACEVAVTAQHRQMLDSFLAEFGIRPDCDLDVMQERQGLHDLTARIIQRLAGVLAERKPDLVLVQGDTTTAMVTALAAFYHQIPVGHVEAGLRTAERYNPFPEEMNRRLIGSLATLHFAPTQTAERALRAENIPPQAIFRTGNTVIDAILKMADKHRDFDCLAQLGIREPASRRLILVTAHRRENWGQPMRQICQAIQQLCRDYPEVFFLFPVHKNPVVRETVHGLLGRQERIYLVEPLDYIPFMDAIRRSYLVLTDSGGVQEEAPSLGKPVLVLRTTTERPEAIEMGTAKLVGVEQEDILRQTTLLLDDAAEYRRMSHAVNPYGDGRAAERIVAALKYHFGMTPEPPEPFAVPVSTNL